MARTTGVPRVAVGAAKRPHTTAATAGRPIASSNRTSVVPAASQPHQAKMPRATNSARKATSRLPQRQI